MIYPQNLPPKVFCLQSKHHTSKVCKRAYYSIHNHSKSSMVAPSTNNTPHPIPSSPDMFCCSFQYFICRSYRSPVLVPIVPIPVVMLNTRHGFELTCIQATPSIRAEDQYVWCTGIKKLCSHIPQAYNMNRMKRFAETTSQHFKSTCITPNL